jgi:hypothetical protein
MDSECAKPTVSQKDAPFVSTNSSHTTNGLPDQRNTPEIQAPV